jgi:hypothetical protein
MKITNHLNIILIHSIVVLILYCFTPKVVSLSASARSNLEPNKIKNIAKKITVQILFPDENRGGSGVIIKKETTKSGVDYLVLTNAHVIGLESRSKCDKTDEKGINIKTSDGNIHKAYLDTRSKTLCKSGDLSLLKFSSDINTSYTVASVGKIDNTLEKDDVYISGFYCNPKCKNADLDIEKGMLTKLDNPRKSGYQLGYNVQSSRIGKSGGSIINAKGELIGIHGKGTINFSGRSAEDEYQIYGLREATLDEKEIIKSNSWGIPSTLFLDIAIPEIQAISSKKELKVNIDAQDITSLLESNSAKLDKIEKDTVYLYQLGKMSILLTISSALILLGILMVIMLFMKKRNVFSDEPEYNRIKILKSNYDSKAKSGHHNMIKSDCDSEDISDD